LRKNKSKIYNFLYANRGSLYQEYLTNYISDYKKHIVNELCNSSESKEFIIYKNKTPTAYASIEPLEWDTKVLNLNTGRIIAVYGKSKKSKVKILKKITEYAINKNFELITCRIGCDDITTYQALESVGFETVDNMAVFLWDRKINSSSNINKRAGNNKIKINIFGKSEIENKINKEKINAIRSMAGNSFKKSRIYNDSNISITKSNNFYKTLFDSILHSDGSYLHLAQINNKPVGFILSGNDDSIKNHFREGLSYLWLIAVDSDYSGKGIGQILLDHYLKHMSSKVRFIEISTQINNYPAINLYRANNLRLVSSIATLHFWVH